MQHFCTPIRTCGQSTGTWQKMLQVLTFCTHRKQNTLLYITVNEFANTCDDSILLTFLHIVFIYIWNGCQNNKLYTCLWYQSQ